MDKQIVSTEDMSLVSPEAHSPVIGSSCFKSQFELEQCDNGMS